MKTISSVQENQIIKIKDKNDKMAIFHKKLLKGLPNIEAMKQKKVVLVLGNTGSGKSSTISYLIGCKMELTWSLKHNKEICKVSENYEHNGPVPKIGHKVFKSETLYPRSYSGENGINYCDLPGFLENRDHIRKNVVLVNTELAIRSAQTISAAIVIIDNGDLNVDKGESVKRLSLTLTKLLKSPEDVLKSVIFVITKYPKKEQMEKFEKGFCNTTLKNLINNFKEKGQNAETDEERKETDNVMQLLSLIQQNPDNVIVVNPCDNGESRNKIIDRINKSTYISKKQFDFKDYDPHREVLDNELISIASNGLSLLDSIQNSPPTLQSLKTDLNNTQDNLEFTNAQIGKIINAYKMGNIKSIIEGIKKLKEHKKSNEDKIKQTQKSIEANNKRVEELHCNISNLQKDDLVIYKEYSITGKKSFWDNWSWTSEDIEYSGIPFEQVVKTARNGCFINENIIEDFGKKIAYSVTYESNLWTNGDANVEIYIKSKNLPENLILVSEYVKKINQLTNKNISKHLKIESLIKQNIEWDNLIQKLEDSHNNVKLNLDGNLDNLSNIKEELAQYILDINKKISEETRTLNKAKLELQENIPLFDMVQKLHDIINFPSSVIVRFSDIYKNYIELSPNDSSLNIDLQSSMIENKIPDEYKCPISHLVMTDPMTILPCEHTFDSEMLLKYMSNTKQKLEEPTCPCCRGEIYSCFKNKTLGRSIHSYSEKKEFSESSLLFLVKSSSSTLKSSIISSEAELNIAISESANFQSIIVQKQEEYEKIAMELQKYQKEIQEYIKQKQNLDRLIAHHKSAILEKEENYPNTTTSINGL